jgi:CheY-like chemotaxis protein
MALSGGVQASQEGGNVLTLIVDDDEDIRALVRLTIETANRGLRVAGVASDGEAALAAWRRERPDCIVIDQQMPGLTGIEVSREILAEEPSQRIVLFTAYADAKLRQAAKALGISAVLSKDEVARIPQTLWALAG